jgi:formylglycine-generating enzyme required for sulfatase activity
MGQASLFETNESTLFDLFTMMLYPAHRDETLMKVLFGFILGFMLILFVTPALEELLQGRVKEIGAGKSNQVWEDNNIQNLVYKGWGIIFQLVKAGGQGEENSTDAGSYEAYAAAKYATAAKKTSLSGDSYIDTWTGIAFVLVKGGCYQMGDTFGDGYANEKPVHEVCLDDYYIGTFKVTQGQWKTVRGYNPSYFSDCGDNCPVENISWDDAQEFIRILNERTGKTYRLLTEAEWEYAARSGGKNEEWAGTSNKSELGDYAWYSDNSGGRTHPVGQKKPNGIGIYDMSGNVWEWVQDIYSSTAYSSHGRINPIYMGRGAGHVFRGGSWYYNPRGVRAAFRNHRTPVIIIRHHGIGFRLAKTP